MRIRLTQIDGKLPNLALMKLAHWYKNQPQGAEVVFSKQIEHDLFEPPYDAVYGSAIFSFSAERVAQFKHNWPQAIVGGTHNIVDNRTVEQLIGVENYEHYDYSILPKNEKGRQFQGSIGFTQRGCRLKCGFCVVPKKEGKARSINSVVDIWRGKVTQKELAELKRAREQADDEQERKDLDNIIAAGEWPRHLHLLDNDFFGQPEEDWKARLDEIKRENFKVCLNQGINTRMINPVSAAELGSIKDRLFDDGFTTHRLYTAWDNIGDEKRFFAGVDLLEQHGIRPSMLLVYMLIGFDKRETWERLIYRFSKMVERGIRPYPMIFDRLTKRGLPLGELTTVKVKLSGRERTLIAEPTDPRLEQRTLQQFQRWAIRKYYTVIPFENYDGSKTESLPDWGQARIAPKTHADAR